MTGRTTAKKTAGERAIESVRSGACDAELVDLLQEINKRATITNVARRWRIRFDDLIVTEDDLTLDEAVQIEDAASTTWAVINPFSTAAHCRAILRVMLTSRGNLSGEQADERLAKATVNEIMDALELYAVSPAPFDSNTPTTT